MVCFVTIILLEILVVTLLPPSPIRSGQVKIEICIDDDTLDSNRRLTELPDPTHALTRTWSRIDSLALATPASVEGDTFALGCRLAGIGASDAERARAIYRWIADRISYDDAAFNRGRYGLPHAQAVLQTRRGVCEDYANLFDALARQAGIASKKIIGFSKGFSYLVAKNTLEPDHAWNAVYIDSTWQLVDVTWAAGYGQVQNGLLHSTKRFDSYWFCTPPEEFIFLHLPSEGRWQLLPQTLSVAEFECLPKVTSDFFKMGYPTAPIFGTMREGLSQDLAQVYAHAYDVEVVDAPAKRYLNLGDSFQLRFICHDCQSMSAQTAGRMLDFEREDSLFCLDIQPKNGTLRIFARSRRFARQYEGIMEWAVRK